MRNKSSSVDFTLKCDGKLLDQQSVENILCLVINVIIANNGSPILFGKHVFCQKHETRQQLDNKAGNIINWRNNGNVSHSGMI